MRLLKYSLLFITFIFTEDFSYKIGKIKLDYNNVEFTFNDRSTTANFNLKKLLLSTSDTDFFIDNKGDNAILHIGPSKLSIQGLVFSFFNHYSQNNFEFNLGNLNFDIYECDFDVIKGREPRINLFNSKFSLSNITLDLSNFNITGQIEDFFRRMGTRIDKLTINRATVTISYNQTNKLKINLSGSTNLGNIKIDVLGTMNQQYPEYSNFQVFDIKLTNLSDELKRIIRTYEFETGNRIPLQNGNIVLDLKNQFNQSRQYQQRNDLDYFK
tara:strand:- start:68 stop:877 length:810 start_codon:yes stop_codon:yes gene_type:complete